MITDNIGIKTLSSQESDEDFGPEFLIQVSRILRTARTYQLTNSTAKRVAAEFRAYLAHVLESSRGASVQCVADNVYFNRAFVKLKTEGVIEAGHFLARTFKRLGFNELAFLAPLDEGELHEFLIAFQEIARANRAPGALTQITFKNITVRMIEAGEAITIDRRLDLVRAYAQLVVAFEDALTALAADRPVAVAASRRALQQLLLAAEGQENLLAGLTRYPNPEGSPGLNGVAVSVLVLLMARKLSLDRKRSIGLALAGLFHDIARGVEKATGANLTLEERRDKASFDSVRFLARLTRSLDGLERVAVAFEAPQPIDGSGGVTPSLAARLVSVATTFNSLVSPKPPVRGLGPDQAVRFLLDESLETRGEPPRFDPRVVRLFVSVVGYYPVGSVLRLSGGQLGIVLSVPSDPTLFDRPSVKVIQDGDTPADYVLELASHPEISILETQQAEEKKVNVVHFLLA